MESLGLKLIAGFDCSGFSTLWGAQPESWATTRKLWDHGATAQKLRGATARKLCEATARKRMLWRQDCALTVHSEHPGAKAMTITGMKMT